MRYPASEKFEIIRTVEGSHLSTKQTLDMLGIPRTTFYRWYDLYLEDGLDGLSDKPSRPGSVWNRIPDTRRDDLIEFPLEHEALSTRELAVKYTDEKRYFISESSAYRILKEADLITAPDYVVIKAAEEFKDKTTAINQMWQTDFTYFKIIGWGWYYLSTVLDDYSRYIISWKLCTTMRAKDVTDTIELALTASCWKNIIYPAILNVRSGHSWSIIITSVTMKVWATSHRQMSTSGETKPSSAKGKRSRN